MHGLTCVGAVHGDEVYCLNDLFGSMTELVNAGSEGLRLINESLLRQRPTCTLKEVVLLAPIPTPVRNVMCVGWNYFDHFQERIRQDIELPKRPTFFTKATTSVIGPGENIRLDPAFTQQLDYEGELAVVLGKGGKNIAEAQASEHIFGYVVANDITARDVQQQHGGQWFTGKSMDGSCPMGPYLVTADEVQDPQRLDIKCSVNGVVKQHSNTRYMMFSIARLIAELSRAITLLPGDIILTGTPEGIGSKRNPPEFLRPGDIIEVEVEGIGVLVNGIQAPEVIP